MSTLSHILYFILGLAVFIAIGVWLIRPFLKESDDS